MDPLSRWGVAERVVCAVTMRGGRGTQLSSEASLPEVEREQLFALAALSAVLDAHPLPVFVIGTNGELLEVSRSGRALLEREAPDILAVLSAAAAGTAAAGSLQLTPIQGRRDRTLGFVVIIPPHAEARVTVAVSVATTRWRLTARQAEVLDLVGRGLTNATVAEMLNIRQTTVEFHLGALFDKAGVDNRATLIARLLEL